MKRLIALSLAALLLMGFMAGCQSSSPVPSPSAGAGGATLKVGMITDTGTVDDRSFNQGTWEGIQRAREDFGVEIQYLPPGGDTTTDYNAAIEDLVEAGYTLIICPGFKFELSIYQMQDKYPDVKFAILDGTPNNDDWSSGSPDYKIADNTVSILFAEQESGFLAGVAAALKAKDGKLGFIGGMSVPAVRRFNWGFQRGVKYANENYDTSCEMDERDIVYQGTFNDSAAGAQLAATMYDRGVKIVFAAAGGVGIGVINEATARRKAGADVWAIGVDGDQYEVGYNDDKTESSVLTSAMKAVDVAAYDTVKATLDGNFPGGEQQIFNAKNDGVKLPDENPNLSDDIISKVNDVFKKMKDGSLKVPDNSDGVYEPAQ